MPDPETARLLRSLLEELCRQAPKFDASMETDVASNLLEAAKQDSPSIDDLRAAGREALQRTPTMWR